jgi:DNA-binding transcriptional LysR family regulator
MNWGAFDLNLLTVFDALMQERNVTRAGARIGLSQSAVSHALGRLRHMLDDDLFIRTPRGMIPTPRAEALAQPLHQALKELRLALEPASFDPLTSDRSFVVAVNNYAALVMAPALAAAVGEQAPGVQLDLRASGTIDVLNYLDRGDIDLAITGAGASGDRFTTQPLVNKDRFVMIMRQGHGAALGALSPRVFAALSYLEISSTHEDTRFIDSLLSERKLARRIALRAPYLSAATILAQSDLVAVLSGGIARTMMRGHALQVRDFPFEAPPIQTVMVWHRRLDDHPAHRWLRTTVAAVAKPLQAKPVGGRAQQGRALG